MEVVVFEVMELEEIVVVEGKVVGENWPSRTTEQVDCVPLWTRRTGRDTVWTG